MVRVACPLHETYEAMDPPKNDCPTCWHLWRYLAQLRIGGLVVKRT